MKECGKLHIAVLITVYNRCEKTIYCLTQLFKQRIPSYVEMDVWMTDDGCTDNTVERVNKEFPHVHIVKGNGHLYWNRGMIAAWNAASEKKEYDAYLWLNDDTQLVEDAISILVTEMKVVDFRSILVGPTTDTSTHKVLTYSGYTQGGKRINPNGTLQECLFFNGNIVLIPNIIYKRIGTNDPYYSHSIGDFDYGRRAARNGYKSYVSSKVLGYCDRHNSIPKWANPQYSLTERWKSFKSPLGAAPLEYFHFNHKYFGFLHALASLSFTAFNFFFPIIFRKRNQNSRMFYNGPQ